MIKSINDVITLNNGVEIPQHGFGVYLINEEKEGYNSINKALEVGYRSFDTAQFYENEKLIGKILSESGIKRSELFITTKVADFNQGYDSTIRLVEQSLKDLRLDEIDLLLIHWPSKKHFFETWNALEKIVIRWHLQKGTIVIQKSSSPYRIEENVNVYDFNLAVDEIKVIDSLNKNQRNGHAPDDDYLKI